MAQLHWSLPRPLSEEEEKLAAELSSIQAKVQVLSQTWARLRQRLDTASFAKPTSLLVGRAPAADLPPAQAAKVRLSMVREAAVV